MFGLSIHHTRARFFGSCIWHIKKQKGCGDRCNRIRRCQNLPTASARAARTQNARSNEEKFVQSSDKATPLDLTMNWSLSTGVVYRGGRSEEYKIKILKYTTHLFHLLLDYFPILSIFSFANLKINSQNGAVIQIPKI